MRLAVLATAIPGVEQKIPKLALEMDGEITTLNVNEWLHIFLPWSGEGTALRANGDITGSHQLTPGSRSQTIDLGQHGNGTSHDAEH